MPFSEGIVEPCNDKFIHTIYKSTGFLTKPLKTNEHPITNVSKNTIKKLVRKHSKL